MPNRRDATALGPAGGWAAIWHDGYMASRKMTFTLPEELAARFDRSFPARDRSRYLADALADKLAEREKRLIRACEIANEDPALK